ncbi:MAG: GDCCVxC domain-containing (seleno)protein [Burkholderiales bacterium]
MAIVTRSVIICADCRVSREEEMPTDACLVFYECHGCGRLLKPKTGDCCVFCSYGTVKCPPIQAANDCCSGSEGKKQGLGTRG